jgi:hypothetical protein
MAAGGQQEGEDAGLAGMTAEPVIVMQHRGNDAGGTVGRRRDHPAAGGVFLVDRDGVETDPIHDRHGIAERGFGPAAQFPMQSAGAPLHPQATGQDAGLAETAGDAGLHGVPNAAQTGVDLGIGTQDAFVGAHEVGDGKAGVRCLAQQVGAGREIMGHGGGRWRCFVAMEHLVGHDEAAADGIIDPDVQWRTGIVEGGEAHAVGMAGQALPAEQQQIRGLVEGNGVTAAEQEPAVGPDGVDQGGDGVGIDAVGLFAQQAEHNGAVGTVADAGQRQGTEQFAGDAVRPVEQAAVGEPVDEGAGRLHRADGVGTGRADADLENVEDTDGHRGFSRFGVRQVLRRQRTPPILRHGVLQP